MPMPTDSRRPETRSTNAKATFEELFLAHYDEHEDLEAHRATCHWCQLLLFPTACTAAISLVNTADHEPLPSSFTFISAPIVRAGVQPADDGFRTGCECVSSRACQVAGCQCLDDMPTASDAWKGARGKCYVYHSTGSRKGLMKGAVLESREPVYECHARCSCGPDCPNRVVERGRKVRLEIFKTRDRGWGVRATEAISRGQFIDKYIGEIITHAEAEERRRASDVAQRKDVYLFALDKFSDPDSMDPRLAAPPLEVDGEFFSGPTRFINHSCEPNCRIFARVGDHADKHMHDLAFFAIDDVLAGDELTFDYVDGVDDDLLDDARDATKRKDMTVCLCGAASCRGFLW